MPDFQLAVHRCPTVNERTTRDDLIAQGLKPEAADELLDFRDRVMQTARSRSTPTPTPDHA